MILLKNNPQEKKWHHLQVLISSFPDLKRHIKTQSLAKEQFSHQIYLLCIQCDFSHFQAVSQIILFSSRAFTQKVAYMCIAFLGAIQTPQSGAPSLSILHVLRILHSQPWISIYHMNRTPTGMTGSYLLVTGHSCHLYHSLSAPNSTHNITELARTEFLCPHGKCRLILTRIAPAGMTTTIPDQWENKTCGKKVREKYICMYLHTSFSQWV